MIGGIGEMLRLEAKPAAKAVELAILATLRTVEEIPRVELEAGFRGQHLEKPPRDRPEEGRRGDQTLTLPIQDPVVIVAASEGELVFASADPSADRSRGPEVHWRARDAAQL